MVEKRLTGPANWILIKVTDFERIAEVNVSVHKDFTCPKCTGLCVLGKKQRSTEFMEFDCTRCGRGFEEMPATVRSLDECFYIAEERDHLLKSK